MTSSDTKKSVTFLHTGDIHLGAPIRRLCNLDAHWSERLQRAIPEAFERLIRTAIERQVDFVIFAGDIFDTSRPSYGEYLQLHEALARLDVAGIPAYIVAGNHDPLTTWENDLALLPPSVTFFPADKPGFALFSRAEEDGEGVDPATSSDAPSSAAANSAPPNVAPLCILAGRSYFSQAWPEDKAIAEGITRAAAVAALAPAHPNADQAPFAIGILHTGLEKDQLKAPSDPKDLMARDMDYWACGHLHEELFYPSAQNPRIVFPGCIQARNVKDTGPRGSYLVTLQEGAPPSLEFVPAASVILEDLTVNSEGCATLLDLTHKIFAELFRVSSIDQCDEVVAQVTIKGETPLAKHLRLPEVLERLREELNSTYPTFFVDKLTNQTVERSAAHHLNEQARRPGQAGSPDLAGQSDQAHHPVSPGAKATTAADDIFPGLLQNIANDLLKDEDALLDYIQNEMVALDVQMPHQLHRQLRSVANSATAEARALLEDESI